MTNSITVSAAEKVKSNALKRQLLEAMHTEKNNYLQKLHSFFNNDEHAKSDYVALAKGVIEAVDAVLNDAQYDDSLFLRNTTKPLKELRQQAVELLGNIEQQEISEQEHLLPKLEGDMEPVYVLMFQSKGHELEKWEQLLRSLGRYVLGRPIYKSEADIQKVIRLRMSQEQDAYVKVAVPKTALASLDDMSIRKDRFDNELIALPAGIISSQHILEFVHGKKCYHFIKGKLIDVSSSTKRN